jgi:hypothetical protein
MLINLTKKTIGTLALLTVFSFGVSSESNPIDYTTSDVVGMFANQGASGTSAGTLTVTEAHALCVKQSASGFESIGTSGADGEYYNSYRSCMSDFVPFKVTGSDAAGSCSSTTVTWSECQATIPAISGGTSFNARNTFNVDEYEGFANFQCSDGQLRYISGGCSSVAQSCEEGEIVEWETTSPLWADGDITTLFVDRFGVRRHSPKGNCFAKMPSSLSGRLIVTAPTANEMPEPERYNFLASSSPQRCFNAEWLRENSLQTSACDYVPRSCGPTTYTHPSGCSYSIPEGGHDEVFVSNNPQPENSVGGVQAHCWDGTWEIKSSSCALSCEPNINAYTWDSPVAGVDRQCLHSNQSYGQRLAPGSAFLINNESVGMDGNVSYSCNNGTIVRDSEFCAPSSCGSIAANTWTSGGGSSCSHETLLGSLEHGESVTRTVGDLFADTRGAIGYLCEYGETTATSSSCQFSTVGEAGCFADPTSDADTGFGSLYCPMTCNGVECNMTGPCTIEIDTNIDLAICKGVGVMYENNLCCYESTVGGPKRCYIVP